MELSYDEIRRIYRLEKSTSRLVEVGESFYNQLNDFVKKEKENYIKSLKEFSLEEARDFANLKKMIEEIFSIRERKILSLALIASRTNEQDSGHMALQEKIIFNEILAILQRQRKMFSEIFSANGNNELKGRAKELETISVRILKEVPAFMGTDMKEYGPFEKDQVVDLPFKVAKLFLERKLGETNEK